MYLIRLKPVAITGEVWRVGAAAVDERAVFGMTWLWVLLMLGGGGCTCTAGKGSKGGLLMTETLTRLFDIINGRSSLN